MDTILTATDAASSEPAGKKTRHEIAAHCGLSLRYCARNNSKINMLGETVTGTGV